MKTFFLVLASFSLSACSADQPLNPSFPLTLDEAKSQIEAMAEKPVALKRPVIVLGGYSDPGIATKKVRTTIERIGGNDRVLAVHFFLKGSFDNCREHVLHEIEKAFPSDDPNWTTEVDVVAGSMGGIVARYAAMPCPDESKLDTNCACKKRLRIARLFTVSTPHLGANMASLPFYDSLAHDMCSGSSMLANLDKALPDAGYELVPYVRLGDMIVGCENTAPTGMTPWWVQNQPLQFAHLNCFRDERILADISRRLRGEQPFTTSPPTPLPPH